MKQHNYQPNMTVTGEVLWDFKKKPRSLTLQLVWYTQGRGSKDKRVLEKQKIATSQRGMEAFQFELPEGPYSFSGKLISLTWAIECFSKSPSLLIQQDIIVSPNKAEIIL